MQFQKSARRSCRPGPSRIEPLWALKKVIVWSFTLAALGLVGCSNASTQACGGDGSYSETTRSDGVQSYCSYVVIISGFRACPSDRPYRFEIPSLTNGGRGAVICSNKRIDAQSELPANVCLQVAPLCGTNDAGAVDSGFSDATIVDSATCERFDCPQPPTGCYYGSFVGCRCGPLTCPQGDAATDGPSPGFPCGNIACVGGSICIENQSGISLGSSNYACGTLPANCSLSPCETSQCPSECEPLCAGRGIREIRRENNFPVVVCFGI